MCWGGAASGFSFGDSNARILSAFLVVVSVLMCILRIRRPVGSLLHSPRLDDPGGLGPSH
jgi:hypothetical protein